MAGNILYGEIYRAFGTDWAFGRKSVGQAMQAARLSGGRLAGLNSRQKAQLGRLVRNAPQVMVKVVSRAYNSGGLKRTVDYIRRDGDLDVETRYGSLDDEEDIADIREAWLEQHRAHGRDGRSSRASLSTHMEFSMPAGTDRAAFKTATRQFVDRVIGANHDYLLSFHDDTDHPHGHVVLLTRGDDGKMLRTDKTLLDAWREDYAAALREHGVDADATPRHSRGVVRKPLNRADYYHGRRGDLSRNETAHYRMKIEEMQGRREARDQPWRSAIAHRHEAVTSIYRLAADELSRSSDHEDRQLGRRLEYFADRMQTRPVRSRDDIYEERLRQTREQEGGGSGRQTAASGQSREPQRDRYNERGRYAAVAKTLVQAAMLDRVGKLPGLHEDARRFLQKVAPGQSGLSKTAAALLRAMEENPRVQEAALVVAREVEPLVRGAQEATRSQDRSAGARPNKRDGPDR